ncbi:mitochondrial carrier domain-containing protein [Piptocephalis cylindrospora]|uniref:Mitochondrial carrier domain-containing protein n=1 Tax=Piptocephalis cylindrospora TaxID=1907219 RepID=A0A4P9Y6B6_9FUNG|nr:mitochondrial carrier domain-containing protein [Piptocephalis cylindrospora]|eukprot:RKP14577.1 mitochondrial carrier domain-containing protein [Piptocephalis cylindrospora]
MVQFGENTKEFVAGTMGGWAQVIVGHPFDTLKVMMQTQGPSGKFNGSMDCLRHMVKTDGPQALYRGMNSPLMGIGICNSVLFTANGYFRRMLTPPDSTEPLSLGHMMIAGGLSGSVMAFVNCPVELLKVKLQVQGNSTGAAATAYRGVLDCGAKTYAAYGFKGLYRGIAITLIRDTPSFAAYFGAYEGLKMMMAARKKGDDLGALELLTAGGFAGIAAWLVCFPQDVIKSRMQSDSSYRTTLECVRSLVRQNGSNVRSYFKGFGPTMARAFPGNAATFLAYEWTRQAMSGPDSVTEPPLGTVTLA